MSGINLELLTDADMYQFIERGIRGGISVITHRHAKANNPYMKFYNPNEEKSYIMYLDANNLYGWAMSQPLPYRSFKWVKTDKIIEKKRVLDIYMKLTLNIQKGYIIIIMTILVHQRKWL